MANEGALSASLSVNKGGVSEKLEVLLTQFTVAGTHAGHYVESVDHTGWSTLQLSSWNPGYGLYVNRDGTNYIELSLDQANAFAKLLPGEAAMFRTGDTVYARANTADCILDYLIIEE